MTTDSLPRLAFTRAEAAEGFAQLKTELSELCFVSLGNVFPKHEWGCNSKCKRCGQELPKLDKNALLKP